MSRLNLHNAARHLIHHTRLVTRTVQIAIFAAAGVLAFLLRFDFSVPAEYRPYLLAAFYALVPAKVFAFYFFKMDRGWWRYASIRDVARLAAANLAGSVLGCLALLWFAPEGFPRSIYVLDFILCFGMTAGVRLAVRLAFEFSRLPNLTVRKRTLIYRAGDAGVTLLREIHQNPALAYEIVGFIDDSPGKAGNFIHRVRVLGNGAVLSYIAAAQNIEMVLIAMPSATGAQMTEILKHCNEAGVSYKTVPGLAEIMEANGLANQIRDVAVEDLLGRNPVHLEEDQIRGALEGRIVLVTGAAGSIGAELCRQIARFHPARIVGFDIAESPLFEIDREMHQAFPQVPFYAEIGSVQNRTRLDEVLGQYSPSVIYHAAAYKHVPLMEAHIFEAIENNVLGTYNLAVAAAEHGVADFVMISSDKAVRPTNVMGATKRIAELLLLGMQEKNGDGRADGGPGARGQGPGKFGDRQANGKFGDRQANGKFGDRQAGGKFGDRQAGGKFGDRQADGKFGDRQADGKFGDRQPFSEAENGVCPHWGTKYVAVRFGNVLGSNGSVIPIFKKQIAAGGPVTVTHPDMRRFFMTIPEACQLVLQAAVIAEGGQICVLDMGEPVKIVDLARNLILLSGRKPDEDIKIKFTGMRPGEKLYEELSTMLEDTAPTAHEKIRIYVGNGAPQGDTEMWLLCLREACEARDAGRLVVALKEIVLDYSPSAHLLKRVIPARAVPA
jgi:FlaA1/EpsC-like NDP-sugar epimerase